MKKRSSTNPITGKIRKITFDVGGYQFKGEAYVFKGVDSATQPEGSLQVKFHRLLKGDIDITGVTDIKGMTTSSHDYGLSDILFDIAETRKENFYSEHYSIEVPSECIKIEDLYIGASFKSVGNSIRIGYKKYVLKEEDLDRYYWNEVDQIFINDTLIPANSTDYYGALELALWLLNDTFINMDYYSEELSRYVIEAGIFKTDAKKVQPDTTTPKPTLK